MGFDPKSYSVGDPLFVAFPVGWSGQDVRRFMVTRITPSGQIVGEVDGRTVRVNSRGRVVCDGEYSRQFVVDSDRANKIKAERARDMAWERLRTAYDKLAPVIRAKNADGLDDALGEVNDLARAIQRDPS